MYYYVLLRAARNELAEIRGANKLRLECSFAISNFRRAYWRASRYEWPTTN